MEKWDVLLFYAINHARFPIFDKIFPFFTSKHAFLVFFFVFLGVVISRFLRMYLAKGRCGELRRKAIFSSLLSFLFLVAGYGLSDFSCGRVLKPLFKRERPFASLEKVYYYTPERKFVLLEAPLSQKTLSFPSCHATNAGFLTAYVFFMKKQTLIITLPTALLIGLSRVYLGHHFPFDVLGGFFFGGILGTILGTISGRIMKSYGRGL